LQRGNLESAPRPHPGGGWIRAVAAMGSQPDSTLGANFEGIPPMPADSDPGWMRSMTHFRKPTSGDLAIAAVAVLIGTCLAYFVLLLWFTYQL